jgi:hypothetical protein
MSIGSAILALAPQGYWPLGDLGPSVIADVAGGGHNMAAQPLVGFSAPGVEPGTYGISVPAAQVVAQINPWFTGNGARTFMCYAAMPSENGPVNKSLGVNVFGATKGFGNFMTGAGSLGAMSRASLIRNGASVTAWNLDPIPDAFWHQYALTYDATNYRLYRDGSLLATVAPGGYTAITADATDAVVLEMPNPGFLAHCAIWASALSGAQILGVVTAETGRNVPAWLTGQGVVNPQIFTDLTALQATVDAILASVRKTF